MVRVVRAGADHRNETQRILGSQVERYRLAARRSECMPDNPAFEGRLSLRRHEAKAQSPGRQASGFRAEGFGQSAELPTAREGSWVPSRARLDFPLQDRLTVETTERKAGIPKASGLTSTGCRQHDRLKGLPPRTRLLASHFANRLGRTPRRPLVTG